MEWDTKSRNNLRKKKAKNQAKLAEIYLAEKNRKLQLALSLKLRELNTITISEYTATGILHDLVTPLTTLLISLDDNDINTARHAAQEMNELIRAHKDHFSGFNQTFSVHSEILHCIKLVQCRLSGKNIEVKIKTSEKISIKGNLLKFHQLITNLLINSVEAFEAVDFGPTDTENKYIAITAEIVKENIEIRVKDNGPGIKAENINRVFLPFYSTKNTENGGIGLFICKHIVENDLGGTICVKSSLGEKRVVGSQKEKNLNSHRGAEFIIKVPLERVSQ